MYINTVYFCYRQHHILKKKDYRNEFFSKVRPKITNNKGCNKCYQKENLLKEIKKELQRLQEVSEKRSATEKLKLKYSVIITKYKTKKEQLKNLKNDEKKCLF